MVTVRLKSFITLLSKQWKKKQKTTVHVEQKIPVVVKIASVNVHVAKAENVRVKENAHAAASVMRKRNPAKLDE